MAQYLAVDWIHSFPDEPICFYLELDDERFDVRKVEKFHDGRLQAVDAHHETDFAFLSSEPVPPNDEIASDPQFVVKDLTEQEFEGIWAIATQDWSS